jgi:dimethylhistidine N-methyltransferase
MAKSQISPGQSSPGFAAADVRAELAAGLRQSQPRIAPKFFYDALGSKLFETICLLDEYYPTRTEAAIFAAHGEEIAASTGTGTVLIDLGAGNCAKAESLFDVLVPRQYVPVDISVEFLTDAVEKLRAKHPALPMQPVGMDFAENFSLPAGIGQSRRLFFYPGSSIGNFTPLQATRFLGRLRAAGEDSAILIGADLVKESRILEAAYDDPLGVTAAFNLNVLRHINRLLHSDFDVRDWRHVARFNPDQSRIEMYLEARRDVAVRWPGGGQTYAAGARLHTENSYKYTQAGLFELLKAAGFGNAVCWTDAAAQFLVCYAQAV